MVELYNDFSHSTEPLSEALMDTSLTVATEIVPNMCGPECGMHTNITKTDVGNQAVERGPAC